MSAVLLVEDDIWLAECYRTWLEQAGYVVYWEQTAQTALNRLDSDSIDLILLDLFLSFANGLQLLHFLATDAQWGKIPVIACSSALPGAVPWRAYGVVATLDKTTLTPRQLKVTVQEVLQRAKLSH